MGKLQMESAHNLARGHMRGERNCRETSRILIIGDSTIAYPCGDARNANLIETDVATHKRTQLTYRILRIAWALLFSYFASFNTGYSPVLTMRLAWRGIERLKAQPRQGPFWAPYSIGI